MSKRIRQEIAREAAKIIALSGHEDYLYAKKKAAGQLGISDNRDLPSNTEIESALIEYQSLFQYDTHADNLQKLRETALDAMQFFSDYHPLLAGSVLTGTASEYSGVILHLFEDTPELVGLFLENRQVPAKLCERRVQFNKNKTEYFTAYKFLAGNVEIVAIVLPLQYRKQSPFDPVSGQPMKRIKPKQLAALIDSDVSTRKQE